MCILMKDFLVLFDMPIRAFLSTLMKESWGGIAKVALGTSKTAFLETSGRELECLLSLPVKS